MKGEFKIEGTTLIGYHGPGGNVIIPDNVTSIGYCAFDHCFGLSEVVIPNSVTTIGSGAFSYCSGLTEVAIPDSVTTIGSGAFDGCPCKDDILKKLKEKMK
jgi:hypothetical protein